MLPLGPCDDERRVERDQRGRKVGRGVAVRDRAADRAAVADLVVADLSGDRADDAALVGEHVVGLEVAVASERADRDVVATVAYVGQVAHATDVDDHRRRRQAQLHQRQQRHAAREELRVLAVLGDERDGLVGGDGGAHVVERGRDHCFVPCICSAAASTDFTMLWYPVQRHRLPSRPRRTSRSLGFGISSISDTAAITMPAVQ